MTDVTQSFRVLGTTEITDIHCDLIDGQYVIHWEDIKYSFPEVHRIKKGNVMVHPMKDSGYRMLVRSQHGFIVIAMKRYPREPSPY
jgi:hypothetical protein